MTRTRGHRLGAEEKATVTRIIAHRHELRVKAMLAASPAKGEHTVEGAQPFQLVVAFDRSRLAQNLGNDWM